MSFVCAARTNAGSCVYVSSTITSMYIRLGSTDRAWYSVSSSGSSMLSSSQCATAASCTIGFVYIIVYSRRWLASYGAVRPIAAKSFENGSSSDFARGPSSCLAAAAFSAGVSAFVTLQSASRNGLLAPASSR